MSIEVVFPDGTIVRGSPAAERRVNATWRDFGLYCAPWWKPTWPSVVIDWPDFGLPTRPHEARQEIVAAFERAQTGQNVEIGCAAGIGRTGTVLACMAVLAGVPGTEAVEWVRKNYLPEAVETAAQAAWVLEFAEGHEPREQR